MISAVSYRGAIGVSSPMIIAHLFLIRASVVLFKQKGLRQGAFFSTGSRDAD